MIEWYRRCAASRLKVGQRLKKDSLTVTFYKSECKNYRGINLWSVVGNLYSRILIYYVQKMTADMISDEQDSFRPGRGYVNQLLSVRQLVEKASQ